ncbi:MAG: hypothetical protein ACKVK5_05935 [Pseudomonadales bacterium]|tara:strand:+ start:365 stop:802 length:438 start_codon:yes stop_codon:yes gene_type:complete
MQKFLYYWLMLVGLGHFLLGLVFIVVAKTSLMTPYVAGLYAAFDVGFETNVDQLMRSMLQLFGPTVASWGLLFCMAVYHYVAQGTAAIKLALITAVLVWFCLDTGVSAASGMYSHLWINTPVVVLILLPLWFLQPRARVATGAQL